MSHGLEIESLVVIVN